MNPQIPQQPPHPHQAGAAVIPTKQTKGSLLMLRNQRVLLDCDIADMYGMDRVELLKAVFANNDRFPPEFAFQLTKEEVAEVAAKSESLSKIKEFDTLPIAFTELGMMMVSFIINSPQAIESSVQVLASYLHLREFFVTNRNFSSRLQNLEERVDQKFQHMYLALDEMMKNKQKVEGTKKEKRRIGFKISSKRPRRPRIGFKIKGN